MIRIMTTQKSPGQKVCGYPSQAQRDLIVAWSRCGSTAVETFSPQGGVYAGSIRAHNLIRVRDLIQRLGMGAEYEAMRQEVFLRSQPGMPPGLRRDLSRIDPRLFEELYRRCRLRGLVFRTGANSPVRTTPLTALQTHIVWLYAQGCSTEDVATATGQTTKRVSESSLRARTATGTRTIPSLCATAYRRSWLPTATEEAWLGRDQAGRSYEEQGGWWR